MKIKFNSGNATFSKEFFWGTTNPDPNRCFGNEGIENLKGGDPFEVGADVRLTTDNSTLWGKVTSSDEETVTISLSHGEGREGSLRQVWPIEGITKIIDSETYGIYYSWADFDVAKESAEKKWLTADGELTPEAKKLAKALLRAKINLEFFGTNCWADSLFHNKDNPDLKVSDEDYILSNVGRPRQVMAYLIRYAPKEEAIQKTVRVLKGGGTHAYSRMIREKIAGSRDEAAMLCTVARAAMIHNSR